jgi:hypothetical protein
MVCVGYIKASAKARNVHLLLTQSNEHTGPRQELWCIPTTTLEGNRARVRRPCLTRPILLVSSRGERAFACGQTLTQTLDTLFWNAIFSMDITSAEGLSNISTLVHSPSKIAVARSLRGDNAQRVIDLIDRVSDSGRRPLACCC